MEPLQNGAGEERAEAAAAAAAAGTELGSAAGQRRAAPAALPSARRSGGSGSGRAEAAVGREGERAGSAPRPRLDSLRKSRPRESPLGGAATVRRGRGQAMGRGYLY